MSSLHESLRSATHAAHRRLDDTMSAFDLRDAAAYRNFLQIHCTSLRGLSDLWGPDEHGDFDAMLAHVQTDLGTSDRCDDVDRAGRRPSDWRREAGIAYVLRGSRFGAAVLLRRLDARWPRAYLAYETVLAWPSFLSKLEAMHPSIDRQGLRDMIAGAEHAFEVFAAAAATRSHGP